MRQSMTTRLGSKRSAQSVRGPASVDAAGASSGSSDEDDDEVYDGAYTTSDGKLRIRTSSNSTRQKSTPKMEDFDLDDDLSDCDECPTVDIDAITSAKSLGDAMRILAPQLEGLPRRSRGKYGKRKHLTPDEKAELTRQRNRENARSTRKRRKMYIKHLQEVVETLKARQEAATQLADPKIETKCQEARIKSFLDFFHFRSSGPIDQGEWERILDPDFRLTLPVTPYRSYPITEVQGSIRVCEGILSLMADTASLHRMVQNTAKLAVPDGAEPEDVTLTYLVNPSDILLNEDRIMCPWRLKLAFGQSQAGKNSKGPIVMHGMCKGVFAKDDKLLGIDLRFDVMGFTKALEELTGLGIAGTTSYSSLQSGLSNASDIDDDDGGIMNKDAPCFWEFAANHPADLGITC